LANNEVLRFSVTDRFYNTYKNTTNCGLGCGLEICLPLQPGRSVLSELGPLENAATLEDIRAKVLAPDRLNSLVFGVFAAVALLIAVVGVAGVLAFSVSARTREFGIRLALGSQPGNLLRGVVTEGVVMAAVGVVAGAAFGLVVVRVAGSYFGDLKMPGAWPAIVSALMQALRSE